MTKHKSFEEQYEQVELIGEDDIGLVYLVPEETVSDVPVFVAPGWAETPEVFKEVMEHLFKRGRILLTISHPRNYEEGNSETEIDMTEVRKADNLLQALEAKGVEKADFVAHSEGAIYTTIAAIMEPDCFRSIVYVNPAGMAGKANFLETARRFVDSTTHDFKRVRSGEIAREQYRYHQIERLKYIASNPIMAFKETLELSSAQIHHVLESVRKEDIKLGVIVSEDDDLFPKEEIEAYVKKDQIDAYEIVSGGHNELLYRPDQYTRTIISLLERMGS